MPITNFDTFVETYKHLAGQLVFINYQEIIFLTGLAQKNNTNYFIVKKNQHQKNKWLEDSKTILIPLKNNIDETTYQDMLKHTMYEPKRFLIVK